MVPLRDEVIAARARREDEAERAKRQHAARSFRMWPTPDGMVEGHFKVTPQVGGAIKAVIEKGTGKRFRDARSSGVHESQDAYAADAFADAVVGDPKRVARAGGWSAHVVIDHEALVRGHTIDGETCEIPGVGPVSVEWVRQLLGTAFVTAIIKKGKDITTVAHFGRHIPAELRTAMIVSGRECSIEGCSGREYLELDHCEIDHAQERTDGVVQPRLALLHPPHPKNPGLDPRPTRPHHRKTKTRPTTTPVTPTGTTDCRPRRVTLRGGTVSGTTRRSSAVEGEAGVLGVDRAARLGVAVEQDAARSASTAGPTVTPSRASTSAVRSTERLSRASVRCGFSAMRSRRSMKSRVAAATVAWRSISASVPSTPSQKTCAFFGDGNAPPPRTHQCRRRRRGGRGSDPLAQCLGVVDPAVVLQRDVPLLAPRPREPRRLRPLEQRGRSRRAHPAGGTIARNPAELHAASAGARRAASAGC